VDGVGTAEGSSVGEDAPGVADVPVEESSAGPGTGVADEGDPVSGREGEGDPARGCVGAGLLAGGGASGGVGGVRVPDVANSVGTVMRAATAQVTAVPAAARSRRRRAAARRIAS
jgi:hypothetical protein